MPNAGLSSPVFVFSVCEITPFSLLLQIKKGKFYILSCCYFSIFEVVRMKKNRIWLLDWFYPGFLAVSLFCLYAVNLLCGFFDILLNKFCRNGYLT